MYRILFLKRRATVWLVRKKNRNLACTGQLLAKVFFSRIYQKLKTSDLTFKRHVFCDVQEEEKRHKEHVERVMARLRQEKDAWFLCRSVRSVTDFLALANTPVHEDPGPRSQRCGFFLRFRFRIRFRLLKSYGSGSDSNF
jgi:hypothetical protein